MDIRYSCNQRDFKRYTTEETRKEFLIETLFTPDTVNAVYSHVDRMVTLGIMPVNETVPLDSKMGELVSIARRKGDEWFVGAICGWEGRELDLDLSFLGEGEYEAEIMRDGSDAGENASSYVHETRKIGADRSFRVRLAPGGGAALRIRKI